VDLEHEPDPHLKMQIKKKLGAMQHNENYRTLPVQVLIPQ
jgi:hypothetical protein